MAFSLGSLIGAMSTGRTQALRGQREQRQLDAEAERQNRLDLFNEYARSRQLAQTDNAQQNAMERAQDALTARETIAARDAQIRDFQAKEQARLRQETLNRESGMDPKNPTQGYRGADRTSRESMNREDNAAALQQAQIRAMAAIQAAATRSANGGGGKPLPPATAARLASQSMAAESKIRDLDEAIAATTGAKDFVGPWDDFRDKTMEKFGQRIDPNRVKARAAYAKVVTPILTGEFGANLTKLEKDYIAPYITALSEATEARIPIVLGMIRKALADAREEQLYGLEASGHEEFAGRLRTPPARTGIAPPPQASAQNKPSRGAAIVDSLFRKP